MKNIRDDYAVVVKNISKIYKIYNNQNDKIKDFVVPWKTYGKNFYALKNVSFTVPKGASVGLLGINGSGKSTLATILAEVSKPSAGDIVVNGESAMISISSGLNGALTGIENIEMKGMMIGLSKKEIEDLKPQIIEFSELGDFVYQPVKSYSSGMKARLGFSISININPDILIIDEALSVGDITFTDKCLDKMQEFRNAGKTIFFVSHSVNQVRQFCDKAIWLEYGALRAYGEVEDVLVMYESFVKEYKQMSSEEQKNYKKSRQVYSK